MRNKSWKNFRHNHRDWKYDISYKFNKLDYENMLKHLHKSLKREDIISKLTSKDDKFACAFTDKIISESLDTDEWYEYLDEFASLLNHPKSLVRNRALYILAANAKWDDKNCFDAIISDFLNHITDDKPITARQCIKALAQIGLEKPQYISRILSAFHEADLSKYKDSMRPLIEKDMTETEKILLDSGL